MTARSLFASQTDSQEVIAFNKFCKHDMVAHDFFHFQIPLEFQTKLTITGKALLVFKTK